MNMKMRRKGYLLFALLFCFISVAHFVYYARAEEPLNDPSGGPGITNESEEETLAGDTNDPESEAEESDPESEAEESVSETETVTDESESETETEETEETEPVMLRSGLLGNAPDEEPPFVMMNVGGFNASYDSLTVEYKYSGNDYSETPYYCEEDPYFAGNYYGGFELFDVPDNWNNQFDVRITLTSLRSPTPAIMLGAGFETPDNMDDYSNQITNGGTVLTTTVTFNDEGFISLSLGFPNAGDPAITEEANDYVYAYCPTSGKTVKQLFAEELVCRLMDPSLFDYFGLVEINNNSDRIANVNTMINRIEESGAAYTVTVTDTTGTTSTIDAQDYTVHWGNNFNNGQPVTSTLPVYTLNQTDEVLICTNFNDQNGRGSQFLICDVSEDVIDFAEGSQSATGICFQVSSLNTNTVKAGGMGLKETLINSNGIYTMEAMTDSQVSYLRVTHPVQYRETIRLIKSSEKYVAVSTVGEGKAYGHIGDNGNAADCVWATGSNTSAVARVYVGATSIHLAPLDSATTGMSGTDIVSVELANPLQEDGVTLNATNLTDITLSFASNFYDEIPLRITFAGGTVKYITITRVGLVIQYQYLSGDPDYGGEPGSPIVDNGEIRQDYHNASLSYNYSYFSGEQIAVWATYYHPTNDPTGGAADYNLYLSFDNGTHRVVTPDDTAHNFNGRLSATGSAVASTTFLIGFEQAREYFDGNVWIGQRYQTTYHEGGFFATVLNAGFNDNTNYSGTQMGSGKGVHWNGHISFY